MSKLQRVFFRIGALASLFTATLHLVGARLRPPPTPRNETEATLLDLMRTYKLDLAGTLRSMHDLMSGFSLTFSVGLAVVGLLSLVVIKSHHANGPFMWRFALVCATWAATLLYISLTHFFIIPTVCCAVVLLGYAGALLGRPAP